MKGKVIDICKESCKLLLSDRHKTQLHGQSYCTQLPYCIYSCCRGRSHWSWSLSLFSNFSFNVLGFFMPGGVPSLVSPHFKNSDK